MQIESTSDEEVSEPERNECAICLQPCVHAVSLPCGHIFCYLCVKGSAYQALRCAVCRQPFPEEYFQNPILVDSIDCKDVPLFEDQFQWLYEGRNGWWIYDIRNSQDIETSFKANHKRCELLIAGFLYVIDFERMIQYRRNEPNRIRRIKREKIDSAVGVKGVAGLRSDLIDVIQQELHRSAEQSSSNENAEALRSESTNNQLNDNSESDNNSQQMKSKSCPQESDNSTGEVSQSTDTNRDSSFEQLEELVSNNLTLRDTRETYL